MLNKRLNVILFFESFWEKCFAVLWYAVGYLNSIIYRLDCGGPCFSMPCFAECVLGCVPLLCSPTLSDPFPLWWGIILWERNNNIFNFKPNGRPGLWRLICSGDFPFRVNTTERTGHYGCLCEGGSSDRKTDYLTCIQTSAEDPGIFTFKFCKKV